MNITAAGFLELNWDYVFLYKYTVSNLFFLIKPTNVSFSNHDPLPSSWSRLDGVMFSHVKRPPLFKSALTSVRQSVSEGLNWEFAAVSPFCPRHLAENIWLLLVFPKLCLIFFFFLLILRQSRRGITGTKKKSQFVQQDFNISLRAFSQVRNVCSIFHPCIN